MRIEVERLKKDCVKQIQVDQLQQELQNVKAQVIKDKTRVENTLSAEAM